MTATFAQSWKQEILEINSPAIASTNKRAVDINDTRNEELRQNGPWYHVFTKGNADYELWLPGQGF
jgi:hypothetical protein